MRTARLPLRLGWLLIGLLLCWQATLIVGTLKGDLAQQRQHLPGSISHQMLHMATGPGALCWLFGLGGRGTEHLLHPSPSNTEHAGHDLLLQTLEISFLERLQALQQFTYFGFLQQHFFHSLARLHVEGVPFCSFLALVLPRGCSFFFPLPTTFSYTPDRGVRGLRRVSTRASSGSTSNWMG